MKQSGMPSNQRSRLIEILVLNEITDDYESLGHIAARVKAAIAQHGDTTTESEIRNAIRGVVKAGFAKGYRITPLDEAPGEHPQEIPDDSIDELHFFITEIGRHKLDHEWPFDEHGALKGDSHPP